MTAGLVAVVAYDISGDGRRDDVSVLLAAHGARVQLSVFEIEVADREELRALTQKLAGLIDRNQDQIRIWPLAPEVARSGTVILGARTLEERADFYIV